MSRHRNVRQLIEDDYYDYDDGYDEYDDYVAAPTPVVKKPVVKSKEKQPAIKKKSGTAGTAKATLSSSTAAAASSPLGTAAARATAGTVEAKAVSTNSTADPVIHSKPLSPPASPRQTTSLAIPEVLLHDREESQRLPLTCVILGHVDAGKSTLTAQLLLSSTTTTEFNSSSHHRSSNTPKNIAWLLDEDEQERQHGITMDVHSKTVRTDHYDLLLLDAPGHADYVPAMITGTAAADAALLVVDATDFAKALRSGQLREHAWLARGLGIAQVLVAINKMDLLEWEQAKYVESMEQLRLFLTQTVGFAASKVRFVPVSGYTGENVVHCPPPPHAVAWYGTGPTLWHALDHFEKPVLGKLLEKPLRILITDVAAAGSNDGANGGNRSGVAVRGKVVQGWVRSGETSLILLPFGDETSLQKLSSLHNNDTAAVSSRSNNTNFQQLRHEYAAAGETIDFVVTHVDVSRVCLGHCLSRANARPPIARMCRAKLWVLANTLPIIRGATALFHMHQLDVPCHISNLISTLKKDGSVLKQRPRVLTSSTHAMVELTLSYPIVMEAFSDCRALGRFVLRRGGDSIAVGRIEQVYL